MTAILGCNYAGAPLLMGDVIESMAPDHAPTDVYIPSVGRVDLPSNPHCQRRISGLVQKVSIIGPNLAFAWCGDVRAAKDILTAIRDANNIRLFDYGSLTKHLDNESPSLKRGDVGLIGLIKDGANWRMFARNVRRYEDQTFTVIWAGGTGAETLKTQLQNFCAESSSSGSTPIHKAISLGTALSGMLITHEVHHLESLKALYGGAYEIATIIDGKCSKVDDLMYVQWFADMNEEDFTIRSLSHVFQYSYWNDLLIVRSVKFTNGTEARPKDDDSYTLIPPVFRKLVPDDFRLAPIPSLAAPIVSHQITFRALDSEVYTLSRIDFANDAAFKVVEKALPNAQHKIECHIHTNFIRDISSEIRRLMHR